MRETRRRFFDAGKGVLYQPRWKGRWQGFCERKVSSGAINNLLEAPHHKEDDYSVLMEVGLDTTDQMRKLCQSDKSFGPLARTMNKWTSMLGHSNQSGHLSLSLSTGLIPTNTSPTSPWVGIFCYVQWLKRGRWMLLDHLQQHNWFYQAFEGLLVHSRDHPIVCQC